MIRLGFRASPADHPWPLMADPRTIENCVGRVRPGQPRARPVAPTPSSTVWSSRSATWRRRRCIGSAGRAFKHCNEAVAY
jgi:hypothetical protein